MLHSNPKTGRAITQQWHRAYSQCQSNTLALIIIIMSESLITALTL